MASPRSVPPSRGHSRYPLDQYRGCKSPGTSRQHLYRGFLITKFSGTYSSCHERRVLNGSEDCREIRKPGHVIRVVKIIHRYGTVAKTTYSCELVFNCCEYFSESGILNYATARLQASCCEIVPGLGTGCSLCQGLLFQAQKAMNIEG